jgi:membrane protein
MGAEFTWAYSHIFGSRKRQPAPRDLIKALDESGADALQSSSEIAKTAQSKSNLTNNLREPSTESLR